VITPLVEKAILNGHGTLRSFSVGGGGLCKIELPVGHFGIMLDFIYYPWQSQYAAEDYNTRQDLETFQEVDFYSNNQCWKFTHKIFWNGYTQSSGGAGNHVLSPQMPPKIDTFISFNEKMYVQFKVPQLMANGTGVITNKTLVNSQSPTGGETEGNNNAFSIGKIATANNYWYFPATSFDADLPMNANSYSNIYGGPAETFANYSKGGTNRNCYMPLITTQILIVPEQNRNFL
jgi:hypothetical protein